MKNMFGEPPKRRKKESQGNINIDQLRKQVEELQKQLKQTNKMYETTLKQLKITESQKQEEHLKHDENALTDEIETIFNGEEESIKNEPDYILLEKPKRQKHKAIEILEQEAVKNVNINRKEIIKRKIEEELRKKELSAKELKILFVDEYNYCSKATFYRYLENLRKEERIDSIKINGKEFLCSIPSKNNY